MSCQALSRKTFSKSQRLLRREEYEIALQNGIKKKTRHFVLFLKPNEKENHRLGLIVTKKVANSVGRNLLKRRIRDVFRTTGSSWLGKKPHDIIFIARKEAFLLTPSQIQEELRILQ